MDGKLTDPQTGIAIRFIQKWSPDPPGYFSSFDRALMLAMHDDRDIPPAQKLADAMEFLRLRVH